MSVRAVRYLSADESFHVFCLDFSPSAHTGFIMLGDELSLSVDLKQTV